MIYTKNGDGGSSSTIKGYPTSKDAPVFQVLGTIDELSSSLGVAKFEAYSTISDTINFIQTELIDVGTYIAGGKEFDFTANTSNFESLIDAYEKKDCKRNGFSISGKTKLGALLDMSRAISRRLERKVVYMTKNFGLKKEVNPYFNRISDLLYVMARYADALGFVPEKSAENKSFSTDLNILNAKSATILCQSVCEKSRAMNISAVCSVCSSEGNLIALIKDDGAFVASIDISQNKAWTAVSLQMSTKTALQYSKNEDELFGLQYVNNPKIVLLPGGQPLMINGSIVGGLGVSGGLGWQDEELSIYGKNLFERGDCI